MKAQKCKNISPKQAVVSVGLMWIERESKETAFNHELQESILDVREGEFLSLQQWEDHCTGESSWLHLLVTRPRDRNWVEDPTSSAEHLFHF